MYDRLVVVKSSNHTGIYIASTIIVIKVYIIMYDRLVVVTILVYT